MMHQGKTELEGGARDAFAIYVDLLGAATAMAALADLDAELRRVFIERQTGDEESIRVLAGEAHRLISTATAVGFLGLARACRDFEEGCGSGTAGAALARTRDVAVAALSEIGRLRVELEAAPRTSAGGLDGRTGIGGNRT